MILRQDDPGLFPAASPMAREVDELMLIALGITAFFSIGIFAAITWFVVRYRRGSGRGPDPDATGSVPVEVTWILVPLGINVALFFFGADLFARMVSPPPDAEPVYVVGKQWMWKIEHPSGRREIDSLTVPKGRPIKLLMTSQDVIHSFFVPAFRVKADVYPSRFTWLWFEADRLGEFPLFCAEYCGTDHSSMIGRVKVVEPEEYERWAAGTSQQSMEQQGEQKFLELGCITCHKTGARGSGPSLHGLYGSDVRLDDGSIVEVDESYLRQAILEPQAIVHGEWDVGMPTYEGQVDEQELFTLVEYLKGLHRED